MRRMRSRVRRLALAALPVLCLAVPAVVSVTAQGSQDLGAPELVVSVSQPTALAFTPDGTVLYVASRAGRLHYVPKAELPAGAADLEIAIDLTDRVCDLANEQGLLGVAVDPEFSVNRFVYLYFSAKKGSACDRVVNRVVRYNANQDGTLDGTTRMVLIDNIPTPAPKGNHNGGDLQFGNDNHLYVSVGDGGCSLRDAKACQYENPNARRRNVLLGKILRVTRDGEIPADNPHTGPGSARCNKTGRVANRKTWCQEIWATGLRNPFRIAFDPAGETLYINDVGGQRWEEINEGEPGANYGWNRCEGKQKAGTTNKPCGIDTFTDPIFDYPHANGLRSITGGAFVPETSGWPEQFRRNYLFADLSGKIFLLDPDSNEANMDQPVVQPEPDGPAHRPVHLTFHEDALYFADIGAGGVFRVVPTP